MNRQQAKELLPIIQAFIDGKEIQYRTNEIEEWDGFEDWEIAHNPTFDTIHYEYRIKPELKYRPFVNTEECWQEMKKHVPFGWIKCKNENNYTIYCSISDGCIFELDFKEYTFADGTPFGIKEE